MAEGAILTPEQVDEDRAYRAADAAEREAISETERDAAERAIVGAIVALAVKYNALDEVLGLDDITIPALKELCSIHNVTASDMIEVMTEIQIQVLQLQAVTGKVWADCWHGLKSRFVQWASEINNGGN